MFNLTNYTLIKIDNNMIRCRKFNYPNPPTAFIIYKTTKNQWVSFNGLKKDDVRIIFKEKIKRNYILPSTYAEKAIQILNKGPYV